MFFYNVLLYFNFYLINIIKINLIFVLVENQKHYFNFEKTREYRKEKLQINLVS